MNALKLNAREVELRFKTRAITRSITRIIICLAVMVFAAAPSFAQLASVPDSYLGIWRRYYNGKTVGTVQLVNYKGRLTGIFSGSAGKMNDDGSIELFGTPGGSPIVESSLSGSDLHLVIAAPFNTTNDLKMTLNGPDKAHLTAYSKHGPVEFELKKVSMEENDAMHVQY